MSTKKPVKPEPKKPWTLTPSDVTSLTGPEKVWGTTKFLPPEDEIPEAFWKGNIYTRLVDSMWANEERPKGQVNIREQFKGIPFPVLHGFIMAHLTSFQPKHEHKIAGTAYMVYAMMEITAILT